MNVARKIIVPTLAALALALLAAVPPASAQHKFGTPVIAVVDVQLVLQTAEAPKGIRAQLQKVQSTFQQNFQGKNDELKKLDQDLQQQRSVLAADAFQKRQHEFEQKVAEAQRDVEDRRNKIQTAYNNAMQQVETVVIQIVEQIAKESGANIVLTKGQTIYAQPDLDITPEVIKRLNAKLPSVAVALPK